MTEEVKKLIIDMALNRVSRESLLHHFGSSVDGADLAVTLLEEAYRNYDKEGVECALIVAFTFGIDKRNLPVLCKLIDADWHIKHEDVVTALGKLADPRSVDVLRRATEYLPAYLDYDESRALAVKAIWALGRIPGKHANDVLVELSKSDDKRLRDVALKQLEIRQMEGLP